MPDKRHARGLIDTSVVIEIERVAADALPAEVAVSAITFAELTGGPHATDDLAERARRAGFQLAVAHDLFVHHFCGRTVAPSGIDA